MGGRVVVALAFVLMVSSVSVCFSGSPATAPRPAPSATVTPAPTPLPSALAEQCSRIGHEHLVFAGTDPQITTTAIIEELDRDTIDAHVRAASTFAAVTWGYDDQPAMDLAAAAQTYWAALKVAQGEYDIDERISFKNAEAAYQALVEVREKYRVFARLTCKPGSGW